MASGRDRDEATLQQGLARWVHECADRVPLAGGSGPPPEVRSLTHATSGLANETVLVELTGGHPGLAVRLPPLEPTFPTYDLATQAIVQNAVAAEGVPAPAPAVAVTETDWIGVPFLAMPRVTGRIPGPAPAFDRWITGLPADDQTTMHDGFMDALVAIHAVSWESHGLAATLPGPTVADALEYWSDYVAWAGGDHPLPALSTALAWCRANIPKEPDGGSRPALLWGDPRLGNLVFDDAYRVSAVLDWDLAALGPAEMDLGWHFGLDAMMEELFGQRVPGFPGREAALARYEARSGHRVADLGWHEVFALTRALAINDRQQRVAAASGQRYFGAARSAGGEGDPLVTMLLARVATAG